MQSKCSARCIIALAPKERLTGRQPDVLLALLLLEWAGEGPVESLGSLPIWCTPPLATTLLLCSLRTEELPEPKRVLNSYHFLQQSLPTPGYGPDISPTRTVPGNRPKCRKLPLGWPGPSPCQV